MNNMDNNIISSRLINQLRYRDIFSYFSIKYLFSSTVSRRYSWAEEIPKHLVLADYSSSYYPVYNFKEISADQKILHRLIFIPTAIESVAEAVLINECSKHSSFVSLPCVYSYRMAKKNETNGVYEPYYLGLKDRHKTIAANCRKNKELNVYFCDIKKFYPSIRCQVLLDKWIECCNSSAIDDVYKKLGVKLIENHSKASKEFGIGDGILTGPLFSHLLANIFFKEIDKILYEKFGARYLRYVDDITLIGSLNEIEEGKSLIESLIKDLGLELHPESSGKDILIGAKEWLTSERDFDDILTNKWMIFVGRIQQFLVSKPNQYNLLKETLLNNKIRLPLKTYKTNSQKKEYIERVKSNILKFKKWYIVKINSISIDSLLNEALEIKEDFLIDFNRIIDDLNLDNKFQRKRVISKIRFLLGRLFYFLDDKEMLNLANKIKHIEELRMHYELLMAIANKDISKVIKMGGNVTQAAAQLLKVDEKEFTLKIEDSMDYSVRQGAAIFRAN